MLELLSPTRRLAEDCSSNSCCWVRSTGNSPLRRTIRDAGDAYQKQLEDADSMEGICRLGHVTSPPPTVLARLHGCTCPPPWYLPASMVLARLHGNSCCWVRRVTPLARTIRDAGDAYQKQLERRLEGLLGMLEPASMVLVGGVAALIAFSMFVPIYSGLSAGP